MIILDAFKACLKIGVLGLSIIFTSTSLIAGNLPSHYPSNFLWTGSIDKITSGSIIIADRKFNTANKQISTHLLNSYNTTIDNLSEGMIVGCILSSSNELISIWELPNSFANESGTSLARGVR